MHVGKQSDFDAAWFSASKDKLKMGKEGRTSFSFGKVMKYNQGADWEAYTEQLDFYFLANGETDDQTQKAILLSNVSIHGDISAAQRLVGTSHTERRRGNVFGDSGPVAKTPKARKISIGCSIRV